MDFIVAIVFFHLSLLSKKHGGIDKRLFLAYLAYVIF